MSLGHINPSILGLGSWIDGMVHANNPVDHHEGGGHHRADEVSNLGGVPQPPLVPQARLPLFPGR